MATTNTKISEAIDELRQERGFTQHPDDALFVAVAAKFCFFEGDYSAKRFLDHYTNGAGDGGIDALFVDPSDQTVDNRLILLQGKFSLDYTDPREFKKEVAEALSAINDLQSRRTATYSKKLRTRFANAIDELGEGPTCYHYAFCIANTLTHSQKINIYSELEKLIEKENQILFANNANYTFEFSLHDGASLEGAIERVTSPKAWVDEAAIRVHLDDKFLEFHGGDNLRGFVYNTSSSEIKGLFEKFSESGGLYAQNNRLFVTSKKIDDKIKKSIISQPDRFWFLNNGILIVCKSARLSGYKLTLEKFSIVNGCQTSTLIGSVDGLSDFRVMIKVLEISDDNLWSRLVGEIAEASNSQKPIKDRDLRSNDPRQRALQKALEDYSPAIYMDIKRGAAVRKKKSQKDWQFVSNEKYGQLLSSFVFQMPGTGRNRKADIFANDEIYKRIFWRKPDPGLASDMLKLAHEIDNFMEEHKPADEDSVEALPYAKHCFLAMFGFVLKIKRDLIAPEKGFLKDDELAKDNLCKEDLNGSFLTDNFDDFEEVLEGVLSEFLEVITSARNKFAPQESFTNFLKSDPKYRTQILAQLWNSKFAGAIKRKEFERLYGRILD